MLTTPAANDDTAELTEPWSRTPRALYFRTVQQAWEWAETHGGTARGLVVRIDDDTGAWSPHRAGVVL